MVSYEQASDWLPFAMFVIGAVFSGTGALVASVHKLWTAATFFMAVCAVSVASIMIYGM